MIESPRNDVLFILKVPPPYGGGEIEHQYIYDELKGRYSFLIFSRKKHDKSKQGRFSASNLIAGVHMVLKVMLTALIKRPKVVFLWLPKDYPAFVRTAIIVSALKSLKIKVIGDLHGMGFSFKQGTSSKKFFEKQINNFYAIRTLSLSISNELRSSGYNNIIVPVDNGVRAPKEVLTHFPTLGQPLRLLYLGAISDSKGFIRVLRVLSALIEKEVDVQLRVVGEWVNATFERQALEMIRQNKLSPFIKFAGILKSHDKWTALQQSHFLLHLSEWDGQPLTIIEAMAAGVPTIAHRVGGIPEMISHEENGFFVENSRQAAEILIKVLGGDIDYHQLGVKAKKTFYERFTLDGYIQNIEKLVLIGQYASGDAISENR